MPAPTPPSMADAIARSAGFREASLRSEVGRAYAVIGLILVLLVPLALLGLSSAVEVRLKLVGAAAALLLLCLQVGVIEFARWSARRGRVVPMWFGVCTTTVECLVPTGAILTHILMGTMPPFAALSSPPSLAYVLLLALATLRLRPGLCLLGGVVGAAGYGGLVAYVIWGLGISRPTTGVPLAGYVMPALLILAGGAGAAWVAREIRRHVEAALGEAETRRKMDRIEHDLAIARSIQRALLPRTAPEVQGYEIAGWNRPADETGGDYFDWQRLSDGRWIITLADVSGHGIGPALVTAACRAYVRASSSHHPDLASLATHVNRLLADDLPDGRFVTMAGVLVEPGDGPLALLSAGHGPIALYVRATGEVQDILPQGMPLAVASDTCFEPAASLPLGPGDVLALITDGFVEWSRFDASGRREQFGLTRLRESLRRHAHLAAGPMIAAVAADVADFAGDEAQQDDLTMVVVRRTD
ncbi:MAG: PP2C family protein-serine/threonine phosphatase [Phycisphaerales bacterium]|nr:PP2C family protein-serine/threonine phosphatase [Phycisphaerales bacterium]